jgi:hypothetical protein
MLRPKPNYLLTLSEVYHVSTTLKGIFDLVGFSKIISIPHQSELQGRIDKEQSSTQPMIVETPRKERLVVQCTGLLREEALSE